MSVQKKQGNAAETTVAARFTAWTGIKYKRRTGSGASDNHDYRTRGDIAPLFPSSKTVFSIEVKSRSTKGITEIVYSDLQHGFQQSVNDAQDYRIPLVVVVDKHKNIYILLSNFWLSKLMEVNESIYNTVLSSSTLYKQSIIPLRSLTSKFDYMELQAMRVQWGLEDIPDINTVLEFAIGIEQPYQYTLKSVPEYVAYYNESFKTRKPIQASHVYHALNNSLIHGFEITKNSKTLKVVALTARTLAHKFRYKVKK